MKENILLFEDEEIKPVEGYEDSYSITSFGRVWSHFRYRGKGYFGGNFLKLQKNTKGYLHVGLMKRCKRGMGIIHRLVAQHYIPNPLNLPQVNHKDGNKLNNHVDNLEWCTGQENMNHAILTGLYDRGVSNYYGVTYIDELRNKKWRSFIRYKGKTKVLGHFFTEIEAAKAYNNYVISEGLNRLLNDIKYEEYLKIVEESKKLYKLRGAVFFNKNLKKPWSSQIKVRGKRIYIGWYETKIEALKAYNKYIIENNINRPLNYLNSLP